MSSSGKGAVSSTRKLLSASVLMAGGTLVSRALGIIRVMLISFILGNGTRQADMLSIATTIPNALYILFAGGALNTVLVPQIVRAIRHDEDGGEAYTNRIMTAFMLVIGVVAIMMTLCAPLVTSLYSDAAWRTPELSEQFGSMVMLAYCTLPQIFFYGLFFLLGQVLNARDQFGPMMWAPIANNVVSIGVLGIYLAVWGTGGDHGAAFTPEQVWLLGLGSTIGIMIQTAVLIPFLKKVGFTPRFRFDLKGVGLAHTFHLAKWTLGFVAVNQLVLVLVNRLATSATATGAGGGSNVYANAHLMWILPHSLITVSLATAMLPNASRLAAADDLEGVAEEARKTMRLALIALVPSSLAFMGLSGPMSVLLFGHGQGSRDAVLIAWTLMAFAVGLIPFTVQFVCLRTFYALENTRTPFLLQCIIAAVNATTAMVLVAVFDDPAWTAAALALAYSLSYLVGVQLSWRQLKKRVPALDGRDLLLHIARLVLGSSIGAVCSWFLADWIMRAIPGSVVGPLLALLVGGGALGGVYVAVAKLLKVRELRSLSDLVRSRLGRRRPAKVEQTQDEDSESLRPTVSPEPASAAALVDDMMPTSIHAIIADGGFHGWDMARLPGQHQDAPPHPVLPTATAQESEDSRETTVLPAVTDESTAARVAVTEPPVEQALMEVGDLLSTRFRLEEMLAVRQGVETWRAHDMVLSRDVVAHVIPADSPHIEALLTSAQKGATATDSRFLRVLDAVRLDHEPRGCGGYVVCEFASGSSLTDLLRFGTFSTVEAAWVVRELADALTSLHAQGLFHEQLNPDNVVITTLGAVKLVGFGVEAGINSAQSTRWSDRETNDVKGLGSLLYAMLVRHWPGAEGWGMPAAPVVAGETAPAHTVAVGISQALDRICSATLTDRGAASDPRITTTAQLAERLDEVLGGAEASANLEARVQLAMQNPEPASPPVVLTVPPREEEPEVPLPLSPHPVPVPVVSPSPRSPRSSARDHEHSKTNSRTGRPLVLTVLALSICTLIVCLVIAALRGTQSTPVTAPTGEASQSAPSAETSSAGAPVELTITATSFDPKADNGSGDENPEQTAFAIDGDPATGWSTARYRNKPDLGGQKPGVGLVLDLGTEVSVASVDVLFADGGESVELRVPVKEGLGAAPMDRQDQWQVVASATDTAAEVNLAPDQPVRTRFLLVYLTKLPKVEDARFLATINELVVRQG
ncbi:MAG: murein biosynthesis integral membrane protein MurJ [Propionibacteriaceae bacterium]|nr:murein biosynthesis integral membrane protein MurJ [Propionibacteriaceae bacterium]